MIFLDRCNRLRLVYCSPVTVKLGGVKMGSFLTGKLGCAWVGAWYGAWVDDGWEKSSGLVRLDLGIGGGGGDGEEGFGVVSSNFQF